MEHHLIMGNRLSGEESACNAGEVGSILGSVGFPGEGNGNPLQYACLGSPLDKGAWWVTVQRIRNNLVTKQQSQMN